MEQLMVGRGDKSLLVHAFFFLYHYPRHPAGLCSVRTSVISTGKSQDEGGEMTGDGLLMYRYVSLQGE